MITHNSQGTVYLKGNYAPGGHNWHQGYLRGHSAAGIWVFDNNYNQDGGTFYPANNIERINPR